MPRTKPLRAAVWGTGRMGQVMVQVGRERPDVEFVAAIVTTPDKEGKDLGEIAGVGHIGAPATMDAAAVLARDDIDLVFYTGIGSSAEIAAYCTRALLAGKDCITLSGLVHPGMALGAEGAAALDAAAKQTGRRFVGTGVAPGFITDVLPAVLLSQAVRFDRVTVRIASGMESWGTGVLRLYGVGLTPEEIAPPASRVSMKESIAVIAETIRLPVDRITEVNNPRISKSHREHQGYAVAPGQVCGFQRRFSGWVGDSEKLVLEWSGAFVVDPAEDGFEAGCSIEVEGGPLDWMKIRIDVGLWDDPYPATAARGFAVIPGLLSLAPGSYHGGQVPFGVPPATA